MPRRKILTPQQRSAILRLPDPEDLPLIARFYTFSAHDIHLINQQRGDENRLGYALVLALLRYPGYPLQPQQTMPEHILNYVAEQIEADPGAYEEYGESRGGETRREHIRGVRKLFGFHKFSTAVGQHLHD